ncbi:MAG: dethiobiotin synthase, partial [Verrucomicrobiota bacterium]
MAGLLVTGTDTGCGKTWFSWLLVKALRAKGLGAVGWKPVCCGEREDAYALHEASEGVLDIEEVNPLWFRTPVAPLVAGELEGGMMDTRDLVARGEKLVGEHEWVIGEGCGGWEVPMAPGVDFSDFAKELG